MTTSAPHAHPAADEHPPTTKPVLNSMQLRKIAEGVAGYRGSTRFWLVLTQGQDGGLVWEVTRKDPGPCPDAVVIPCETIQEAERTPVVHASIRARGAEPVDLLHLDMEDDDGHAVYTADAVFWGDSSVEKFVVPYYASVYGNDAGEAVTELLNAYNGVRTDTARNEDGDGEPNRTTAYALVHIPRSEYIEMEDEPSTTARTPRRARHGGFAVLSFNPATGEHRAVRVEEYRKRRGGA